MPDARQVAVKTSSGAFLTVYEGANGAIVRADGASVGPAQIFTLIAEACHSSFWSSRVDFSIRPLSGGYLSLPTSSQSVDGRQEVGIASGALTDDSIEIDTFRITETTSGTYLAPLGVGSGIQLSVAAGSVSLDAVAYTDVPLGERQFELVDVETIEEPWPEQCQVSAVIDSPVGRSWSYKDRSMLVALDQQTTRGACVWFDVDAGRIGSLELHDASYSQFSVQDLTSFLKTWALLFGFESYKLNLDSYVTAPNGTIQVRLQESESGIPVFGSGLVATVRSNGRLSIRASVKEIDAYQGVSWANPKSVLDRALASGIGTIEDFLYGGSQVWLDLSDVGESGSRPAYRFRQWSDSSGLLRNDFFDAETMAHLGSYLGSPAVVVPESILELGQIPHLDIDFSEPRVHIDNRLGVPDFMSWGHIGGLEIPYEQPALTASNFTQWREQEWVSDPRANSSLALLLDAEALRPLAPEEVVYRFLEWHPEVFGTITPRENIIINDKRVVYWDPFGFRNIPAYQEYGGLPVVGGELKFRIGPNNRLFSVSGHYVPGIRANIEPNVALALAIDEAREHAESAEAPGFVRLAILPWALAKPAGSIEARGYAPLVYEIHVGGMAVFVSARSKAEVLFAYSLEPGHDVLRPIRAGIPEVRIYDANATCNPLFTSGTPNCALVDVTAAGANPDAVAAEADIQTFLSYFYETHDLFPYDYIDSYLDNPNHAGNRNVYMAVVDVGNPPMLGANASHHRARSGDPAHARFWNGWVADDVVGHEYIHGVIANSSRLIYAEEPGALNESLADSFGTVIFPDAAGTWYMGESLPVVGCALAGGGLRDLENPANCGDPGHQATYMYPSATISGAGPACSAVTYTPGDGCDYGNVHSNSGIPNSAFVKIVDGIFDAGGNQLLAGLGRDKAAALYFYALTHYLDPWSGFSNMKLSLEDACTTWNRSVRGNFNASWSSDLGFQPSDCDVVTTAFNQVGISAVLSLGWPVYDGEFEENRTFFKNPYNNGCTTADYILKVDPMAWNSPMQTSSSPNNRIALGANTFGAQITSWSSGEPERNADVYVWGNNAQVDSFMVDVEFTPNLPAGLTVSDCEGAEFTYETHRTTAERHYTSIGFFGGKGDDWVDMPGTLPNHCFVAGVRLEKVRSNGVSVMDGPAREVGTNNAGARVKTSYEGTQNTSVEVHWWYNAFSIMRYRVVYTIENRDPVNQGPCL